MMYYFPVLPLTMLSMLLSLKKVMKDKIEKKRKVIVEKVQELTLLREAIALWEPLSVNKAAGYIYRLLLEKAILVLYILFYKSTKQKHTFDNLLNAADVKDKAIRQELSSLQERCESLQLKQLRDKYIAHLDLVDDRTLNVEALLSCMAGIEAFYELLHEKTDLFQDASSELPLIEDFENLIKKFSED